ncbi:MAG TPA: hypothetical protein VIG64_04010 [Actinomycetota bacterium]|jgi:hypothetical protein
MSLAVRIVRYVWAAPASLLGLALAPFFDSRRVDNGILLCEGARWPRRLGWRFSAITFGHVVLSTIAADEDLMEHETVHVGQYERWGVFLLPAYLVASLWVRLRGRRAYWDNPFEKAARRTR